VVDVRGWDRVASVADTVVDSCGIIGVKPNASAEVGTPDNLLALAVEVALTARTVTKEDAAAVAAHCFQLIRSPYRRRATIGGVRPDQYLPPLVADAVVAAGWLARVVELMTGDYGQGADEAGRNCLDACVRLHVFTGLPASQVERTYQEHLKGRRKGPAAGQ